MAVTHATSPGVGGGVGDGTTGAIA
jgi:hypothetical protein